VAPDCEALTQRLQQMNARAPVHKVTHGDIDLGVLFDIEGFVLNDKLNLTPLAPLFRRIPQAQNNIQSIVVYHDQPLELMQVSEVMEGLLLEYADSLLRYKGILSIKDEPRRLLFQGVQRLYNADWDREWLPDEERLSTLVFIGVDLPEDIIRHRFAGLG
jgi:G3E family GTPase